MLYKIVPFVSCVGMMLTACRSTPHGKAKAERRSNDARLLSYSAFTVPGQQAMGIRGPSEEELQNCERLANAGNSDAARSLAGYYYYRRQDGEKGLFWTLKAAEAGDSTAQWNAFVHLWGRKREPDKTQAIYWLKKAAAQGHEYATPRLKQMQKDGEIPR